MTETSVFSKIGLYGILPVIKIPSPESAAPLAKALTAGGLPLIEVTMRNADAAESMARIASECPDMLLGAGTVIKPEMVDIAAKAGAVFIVSPGYFPDVEERCAQLGLPYLPAVSSAGEVGTAYVKGYRTVKFFPSEVGGGVKAMKEFGGPYKDMKYIATSGIKMSNLAEYMASEQVLAVGGSFMAPAALVESGAFDAITALCREAVKISMGFHLVHVGINFDTAEEASATGKDLAQLLGLAYLPGNSADFVADIVECRKVKAFGGPGHLAVGTYNVLRARNYLASHGAVFRDSEAGRDKNTGEIISLYLDMTFGGFGVHLLKHIKP